MTKSTITREPITHDLKIYPEFFSAVCTGVKRAELRKNDRDYRVGDTLHLMETPRGSCHQTGEFINVIITHIADVGEWMPGYVLLSVELQESRKADSEPVAWTDEAELRDVDRGGCGYLFTVNPVTPHADERRIILLYRHAQPAREYGDVYQGAREDLAIWKRRALEAEERVRKLEQINDHLVKEAQGESRMGEPVIAQPAPVVPEDVLDALQKVARIRLDLNDFDGDRRGIADCLGDAEEALIEVVNRRAAMLQELQKSAGAEVICRSNENVQALNTIKATPALGSLPKTDEVQNTNSPVIPDGYVMVPVEPNGDMLAAAQDAYGETDGDIASTLRAAMLAAAPQSPGSEPAKDDRDHQLCRRCNDGIRGGCSSCAYNVR